MFEEKRKCASCGRVPGWSEIVVNCSDQKRICVDCIRKANLPNPPMNANGQVHPWDSMKFLKRIYAHNQYDDFCKKDGTQKLIDGYFLINDVDKTFAVGSNDYDEMLVGFQSASYENIDSIAINDGVTTKSIKVSDGDSGAAGALFGGLVFGALGAVVGGLGTREDAAYGEIVQTNNIGFTITYSNTSHEMFNVLELCLNYNFVNYDTQRDIYDKAKQLTVKICEELYKKVNTATSDQPSCNSIAGVASPGNLNININPNNVEPTLTRIEMFMEDGEWDTATAYTSAALDYFPTDYRLYLLSLCIDMKVETVDGLTNCKHSFRDNRNYKRLLRFADSETINRVDDILNGIEAKAEEVTIQEAAEKVAVQAQQEEQKTQLTQLKESYVENLSHIREITKQIDKRIIVHAGMAMYLSVDDRLHMTTPVGPMASQYKSFEQELINWGEIKKFRWDGLFGKVSNIKVIALTKDGQIKHKIVDKTMKMNESGVAGRVKDLLWSFAGPGTFTYALLDDNTLKCIQYESAGIMTKMFLHGQDKTDNLADIKDILLWSDRLICSTNNGALVATDYSGNPAKDTSPWRHISGWKDVIKIGTVTRSKVPYGVVGLTNIGKVLTSMFVDTDIIKEVMYWEDIADIVVWPNIVIGIKRNGDVVLANKSDKAFVNACTEWSNIVKIIISDTGIVGLRGDG